MICVSNKRFNYKNYFIHFAAVTATEDTERIQALTEKLPKIKCFKNCEEYAPKLKKETNTFATQCMICVVPLCVGRYCRYMF